jgi:hypothetical protein
VPISFTRSHHYEAVIAGKTKPPAARRVLFGPFLIEADSPDEATRAVINDHAADFEEIDGVELIHVEEIVRVTTGPDGRVVETRRLTVSRVLRPMPPDIIGDYIACLTPD